MAIETVIQKGFWTGISGTVEHTETLTYMINHARCYQRNLVITLLDRIQPIRPPSYKLSSSLS